MNKETKPPSGLPETTAFIHVRAITQRPSAMLIPNFFKHYKVCFTPLQDMVCLICWKTYISEFCISKPPLFQIYFFFNTFLSLLVSFVFSAFNSSAFPPTWGLYSLWFSLTHFYNPFVSLSFSFRNIFLYLILIFSWSFLNFFPWLLPLMCMPFHLNSICIENLSISSFYNAISIRPCLALSLFFTSSFFVLFQDDTFAPLPFFFSIALSIQL